MRFTGKVALITGAGSGIGAATARLTASQDAAVGVMGRTARTVERTMQQVGDAGGRWRSSATSPSRPTLTARFGRRLRRSAGSTSWWRMPRSSSTSGTARSTSRR